MPEKRDFYKSLYNGNIHRFGQRENFVKPENLMHLITVPTEENLKRINFAELFVQVEFKAIIKIKM